ncbi:DUF2892 domain-containing protein [Pseudomonas stutzeri]|uniref:DUF2892 domain-containing protein n=1 Tax=Stutzerimonas stutzeri TaxID=316 RepID=A0A2N8RZL3_STUST|nr:DUF2892 domain-containing protein [Stutzerimonas stutzeri]MCQ4295156.1 DUF2892 domain-containing protein [Stutzerimonas stutzeri]PNF79823.1 hypothetical protein CXK92_14390 [Stutzerimonas stutzeri]
MIKQLFDKSVPQNVHGWERAASLAGGLVLMGKGLRRGGIFGLAELAMGGMALARGISGRCEGKRMLTEMETKPALPSQRYSHMPMDSEVHSPDFQDNSVTLPDSSPMGNESPTTPRV